jgi:type IV secretion system protein VirD4
MKSFFYHLNLWFSRINAWLSTGRHLYTARLAYPHETAKIAILKTHITRKVTAIYLAIGQLGQIMCLWPTKEQDELGNIFLDGMTRAGKGLTIETNLFTWPHSVIVNDIKGELYNRTAGFRAKGLPDAKVFRIDPRGYGNKFDPLEGKITESDLRSAATTLLHRENEGENKVFTERAITMLTQIFIAARLEGQRPLPFTYKMLNEGLCGVASILKIISEKYNFYPNLATKFLDIPYNMANFESKFLHDCYSTMTARINNILTKETVRSFTDSDFTARDIITSKTPISVYLHWPEKDLLFLSPLIQLILDSLLIGMTDVYDDLKGVGCYRVLAFLDEIFRVGLPLLPKYATTVCGRDISLFVTSQSISQVYAAYGQFKAKEMLAQFGTRIRFVPADKETAKDIEEDLYYKSGFAHSKTEHEGSTSSGENEQRIPVLSAHQIRFEMDIEEVIGFRAGIRLRPFKARRMDWRRFPILSKRSQIPPPELQPLPPITDIKLSEPQTLSSDNYPNEHDDFFAVELECPDNLPDGRPTTVWQRTNRKSRFDPDKLN